MARRRRREEEDQDGAQQSGLARIPATTLLKFAGATLAVVIVVFAAGWALWQSEQFLTGDRRFRLSEDADGSQAIAVTGLKNASKSAVLRVFEPDRERSIYELNPDARRMQLRTVEWVRDASVRRAWPNHVMVEITEREPVAFIQVPSGASGDFQNPISYKPMLIDADGVLLPVRGPVPDGLPLLTGVRVSDDVEVRRSLVKQMLHLMVELKEVTRHINEVDVTEPDSLRITYQMPDRPFVLILGNENYRSRLSTFLKNYDGIRHGLPEHAVLDISLEGRVTAVRPDGKSTE